MIEGRQNRLLELFLAHSQGTLDQETHQELQDALATDVDVRKLWFQYQDLEIGLKCLTQFDSTIADNPAGRISSRSQASNQSPHAISHLAATDASSPSLSWIERQRLVTAAMIVFCLSGIGILGAIIAGRQSVSDHMTHVRNSTPRLRDFVVESPTHGTKFCLSEHPGKLIAVHFLLKTECPFCLQLAHDYAQLAATEFDVVHLFLKPDGNDEIKAWAEKISQTGLRESPVIYRDPNAFLADEFGVPTGYQFHGQTIHFPALVLVDGTGKELFRYVGKDHTDRMKPDEFLAKLAMVSSQD